MGIFLGIDGGGTKTVCLIGDDNSVLGSARASASNVVRVGEAQTRTALHSAIKDACQSAGVAPGKIQRACVGLAGAASSETSEMIRRLLAEILTCEIEIVGDMVITLEAAFASGPGVITIAGTGSIVYGRNAQGVIARAGGWGFAISDEGSGQWIVRNAISAGFHAFDRGEDCSLLDRLTKAWGLSTQGQLVLAANATPAPDFAASLPVVLAAADANDPVARNVLSRAGEELAGLAKIVIDRLFPGSVIVPLAMSGGVFVHSALVREVFYNSLRAARPNIELKPEVVEPVQGALSRARRGCAKV